MLKNLRKFSLAKISRYTVAVCVCCVQPVCDSCNVQSKGMHEWVVEQCVQPGLTMAAARVPYRDHVLRVCVCVFVLPGEYGCAYYARKFNDYAMMHCPRNVPIMLKKCPLCSMLIKPYLLTLMSSGTAKCANHQHFTRELA